MQWMQESNNEHVDLIFVNGNLIFFSILGLGITTAVWWGRCSAALLWAGASAAVGFIIGFLFGFPRTIAQPVSPTGAPVASGGTGHTGGDAASSSAQVPDRSGRLAVNTNLEQVSDWITKTIVGVGLVEIKTLLHRFADLSTYAATTLGKPVSGYAADPAAGALIAYFSILGFLAGYLITRMFFQGAFNKVDRNLDADIQALRLGLNVPAIGTGSASVANAGSAAAQRLKDLSTSQALARGVSSAELARANLVAGSKQEAVLAYISAIGKDPFNPQIRFEYASALEALDRPSSDVISALLDALSVEFAHPNPDLRRKIYESLMYLYLYEPPPQGFTQAISYGEQYTSAAANLPSDVVWVNLACAYGQQAASEKPKGAPFGPIRDKAFAAAREAIRLDPSNQSFLAGLMEPTPDKAAGGEDDLAVFSDDSAFRTLLGLPPK